MTLLKRTFLVVSICLLSQSQVVAQSMVNILIQNQGPCAVDIYDRTIFEDVFLTILDPGESYSTTVQDATVLRAKSSPSPKDPDPLYDDEFSFSAVNNTWLISTNYCNPSCSITCPPNVSLNSGDSFSPSIQGEPSSDCSNYNFTYTDSNIVNGIMTRNWTGNFLSPFSCGDIANNYLLRFRYSDCSDVNNSFVGGLYQPTLDYDHDCGEVTSTGLSIGSGLLNCTPFATRDVELSVDADDDCNGFGGDQMGTDTDNDIVSFSFLVVPKSSTIRVGNVLLRHFAPEFVQGTVLNNQPQQLYVRVYEGSNLLYSSAYNIPTTSTAQNFPINTCVDSPTIFKVELLPSCPVNPNSTSPQIWKFTSPAIYGGCPAEINYPTITCSQQFVIDCDMQDLDFVSSNPYPDGNFLNGEVEYFITDGTITANNILDGGANITYDSGDCIELNTGFEVKSQAVFEALIDGCN